MFIIQGKNVWTQVLQSPKNHPSFYKKATGPDLLDRIKIIHDIEVIQRSWPELAVKKHHEKPHRKSHLADGSAPTP